MEEGEGEGEEGDKGEGEVEELGNFSRKFQIKN